ncbi:MAG: ABC transporter substrate-binding protein [Thermodesulfobacteriota bacterium]
MNNNRSFERLVRLASTFKICLIILSSLLFMLPLRGLADETIKVGIILPLTGPKAKFGEIEKNSFLMALEEINNSGGIRGRKIELIIEDTTGKPDVARSAVEKLITRNKVRMIGGGYSSSATWAAVAVAQQRRIPFLINTAAADKITERRWKYIFRLNPPVSEYASSLEEFWKEVIKPKTMVILHENTLFGTNGAKQGMESAKRLGIKLLMKQGYEEGTFDFKPLLTNVKALNPDVIYMVSYVMDAAQLMRQAKELDINPRMFAGGAAGFTLPMFEENAGDAAQYVFSATLWTESVSYPGAREYYDNYLKKYNKTTEYHGAEAYSAMYVIADALKRANTLNTANIRQALAETDMMTPFGPVKFISYGKKTQQNKLPTYVVQWIDGRLETVWPKEVATKPYLFPVKKWKDREE